jgi:hypothetical protein
MEKFVKDKLADTAALARERSELEDRLWQESNNDPNLYEMLLFIHDTREFLASADTDNPENSQLGAKLQALEEDIVYYGEPINDVERRVALLGPNKPYMGVVPELIVRSAELHNSN